MSVCAWVLVCRGQAFWVVVLWKEGWFGLPQTCWLSRSTSECLEQLLVVCRGWPFVLWFLGEQCVPGGRAGVGP